MSRQRNQNDGNLKDILRRLYRLERQSPLAHSAIGREGLEVYDGGWIRILNGGLQVIGTATISGTLDVTGTTNLSGVTNITGPLNVTGVTSISGQLDVTGPTNLDGLLTINGDTTITGLLAIDGDTTITGTLDIDGVATLNNDLNVTNSGEINVGTNMTFTPSTDGGSILFQDGSKVTSVAGTVQVKSSNPGVGFTAGLNTAGISAGPTGAIISVDDAGDWVVQGMQSSIQSSGPDVLLTVGGRIDLNAPNVYTSARLNVGTRLIVDERLIVRSMPTAASGAVANVYVDSGGFFWKI